MTSQDTDRDALREQVRARYAAAATKVTIGQGGGCGCGQPAGWRRRSWRAPGDSIHALLLY